MKVEKKFSSAVLLMMAANFIVKFFGLLREVLIAKYYGTSIETDAYIIAHSIPTVLFSAIASAIATTFIPMYARICVEEDEKRANSFTLHLMEAMCILCLGITILGEIFVKDVVLIFAPGFSSEALALTEQFVRILFPSVFAMTLFDLQGGYMQLHEKYVPYALVPAVGNVMIILFLLLSNYYGNILLFVWGTLIGLAAQVIFYLPWSIRIGLFRADWRGLLHDRYVRKLVPLLMPVFIGGAVNEINSLVDKSLVSGLGTGSVASLSYAYKVISLVTSVMVAAIVSFVYPKLSGLASHGHLEEFRGKGQDTITGMFAVIFPVSVLVILFRTEIVRVLFQRGSFDETSVLLTASALAFYAVGITAIGIRDILVKMFYSLQNTKVPMLNGIAAAGTNIFLDLILIRSMGHNGAALATSLTAILAAAVLSVLLHRKKILRWREILPSVLKSLFSGGIAGAGVWLLYRRIHTGGRADLPSLCICIILGGLYLAVYLLLQWAVKNPVLRQIRQKKTDMKL